MEGLASLDDIEMTMTDDQPDLVQSPTITSKTIRSRALLSTIKELDSILTNKGYAKMSDITKFYNSTVQSIADDLEYNEKKLVEKKSDWLKLEIIKAKPPLELTFYDVSRSHSTLVKFTETSDRSLFAKLLKETETIISSGVKS